MSPMHPKSALRGFQDGFLSLDGVGEGSIDAISLSDVNCFANNLLATVAEFS
jgi:Cys-tRNA synthase (O-phospho-L-seryl-tRNA:Cys-tRNA synthase)